jgi:chemotaxis family two-component system sensor kinase Cph1
LIFQPLKKNHLKIHDFSNLIIYFEPTYRWNNMDKDKKLEEMRRRAEDLLSERAKDFRDIPDDFLELIHELQVHQIELEMQNEELRNTQIELEKIQRKYYDFFNYAPVGYLSLDENGIIIEANFTVTRILGYRREYITKMPFSTFVAAKHKKPFQNLLEKALSSLIDEHAKVELISKDGHTFHAGIEISVNVYNENARELRMAIIDIDDLKMIEIALKESEEKYRSLFKSINEGFILLENVYDEHGEVINTRVIDMNPAFELLTGLRHDQVMGKLSSDFLPCIIEPGWIENYNRAVKNDKPIRFEEYSSQLDKWFSVHAFKSQKDRVALIFTDISKRKQAEEELRETVEMLKQSNYELEQFAYVASHDLKEPLRTVISFLQLLHWRYDGKLDKEADEFIKFAVDGAERMHNLIDDLLVYSRINRMDYECEKVKIEDVMEEVKTNLKASIEESNAVINYDPLPSVTANRLRMIQLFQNLIDNSIKYRSQENPEIHISAQKQGGNWLFSVEDNGMGIDPKYGDRIFRIFQRLHGMDEYSGTGVGLAVCKKIVEQYGGKIWMDSEPGEGSKFYFTIPIRDYKV